MKHAHRIKILKQGNNNNNVEVLSDWTLKADGSLPHLPTNGVGCTKFRPPHFSSPSAFRTQSDDVIFFRVDIVL
jgi:hypothetical protein